MFCCLWSKHKNKVRMRKSDAISVQLVFITCAAYLLSLSLLTTGCSTIDHVLMRRDRLMSACPAFSLHFLITCTTKCYSCTVTWKQALLSGMLMLVENCLMWRKRKLDGSTNTDVEEGYYNVDSFFQRSVLSFTHAMYIIIYLYMYIYTYL